ncbi:MAG: PaaI family thioesterase [Eggerthellaceae bacterium]|nr:PaaI family thioesterase [Eggerthellaceae bacterium]
MKVNPKHVEALLRLINRGPYFELLSMEVCELSRGYSRVETVLEKKHMNPFGAIHGGAYSSILDTAAYWSAYCELDEDVGFTSIDLSVSNLSMVDRGRIIAEGRSLKVGRSICLTEASVKDTHGKLLAYGTSKLMVLKGRQSIKHVLETIGGDALPPKFID